jgi:beta-mannanase
MASSTRTSTSGPPTPRRWVCPFVIRFNHEMNGFWYPWSEQTNGNSKGEYVKAWRHVHDRFAAAGATNVVWLWSPNVIGSLKHISLAEPVSRRRVRRLDGLVGYYRRAVAGKAPSFTNTFGQSLTALREVASKPIYLSEIGATETGGNKAAWIKSFFAELPSNPDVIGFNWFNRAVTAIPLGQTQPVTNDWRITSSPRSLAAFKSGIADERYNPPAPVLQGLRVAAATGDTPSRRPRSIR